ncbi:hypothetical protein GGF46_001242 [Coemansia sp. RSA 552]|nr:hypothetical protein GGF46_001242 [Coemansia sp. RSA 552]
MAEQSGTGQQQQQQRPSAFDAAMRLYNEAVHETPPNRTKLDNLLDSLCAEPQLLYDGFFNKGHDAASMAVDVGHNMSMYDENLAILTPPAAWGWTVMEETVCHAPPASMMETVYPQLARKFLELGLRTMEHIDTTPGLIVRKCVQGLTRFWPEIIRACISRGTTSPVWSQLFEKTLVLAVRITQLASRSDDPVLQMHLVKFLETEATVFTELPSGESNPHGTLSLERIPEDHPFISRSVLARRGEQARQQLVRLLPSSDHMQLCNTSFITAIINSVVYLMNLRPQFCRELLDRLTQWYAVINSSEQMMTHLQLTIVGKTLRIALLHLYTRRYMGGYSELLEQTLDRIGGREWAAWQESQARERERRERHKARQQQQQQQQQAHTQRWVPAPEEGDTDMADQPAPGADDGEVPPPPPGAGRKRGERGGGGDDSDSDEEKQVRLLAENAKRIRLDDSAKQKTAEESATAAAEERERLQREDRALEQEMQGAVQEQPEFAVPEMETLSAQGRRELVTAAIRRVNDGSEKLRAFIKHKRAMAAVTTTSGGGGGIAVLANGLSTNSGVLEDSMVMMVRLVTNCYMVCDEISAVGGVEGDMVGRADWKEMHAVVEDVLQTITAAPRELYGLSMIFLYELWMTVVVTDPELSHPPNLPATEHTVFALYMRWSERIFDALIAASVEATNARASSAAMETETSEAQQPAMDDTIAQFIQEAPYLPPDFLLKLEGPCLKVAGAAAQLGIVALEKGIDLRPPLLNAGLNLLMSYSVHHERTTRVACIRAVKRHYSDQQQLKQGDDKQQQLRQRLNTKIESAAVKSFVFGVEASAKMSASAEQKIADIFGAAAGEGEDVEQRKAMAQAERRRAEQAVEQTMVAHSELLMALCTKNMLLLSHIFLAYRQAPGMVQVAIHRMVTPLVKSVAAAPAKILPVLTSFPQGAEKLALRTIFLLTPDAKTMPPPKDLVDAVLKMCDERGLGGDFLIFLVNGMDRSEAIRRLPMITRLLNGTEARRGLVRESFSRLTSSVNRTSLLSPTELLVLLHNDVTADTLNQAMEAVGVLESMRTSSDTPVCTAAMFDAGLKLLIGQEKVSPLLLHTGHVFCKHRGGSPGMVINLLGRLIERKVWKMDEVVLDTFVRSFKMMLPGSLALVKQIPSDALKKIVGVDEELTQSIKAYVSKMPEKAKRDYKWLLKG